MFSIRDLVTIKESELKSMGSKFKEFYKGYIQHGYCKVVSTSYFNGIWFADVKVVWVDENFRTYEYFYMVAQDDLEYFKPKHVQGELSQRLELFLQRRTLQWKESLQ